MVGFVGERRAARHSARRSARQQTNDQGTQSGGPYGAKLRPGVGQIRRSFLPDWAVLLPLCPTHNRSSHFELFRSIPLVGAATFDRALSIVHVSVSLASVILPCLCI